MPLRLLIVDDSPFSRKMTIRALPTDFAFEIVQAENGLDGLQKYMSERPDLVLMDLTMPVMDGMESLERIRAADPRAKVVVLSADVQPLARERCDRAGAVDFISKPVSRDVLRAIIQSTV